MNDNDYKAIRLVTICATVLILSIPICITTYQVSCIQAGYGPTYTTVNPQPKVKTP